MLELVEILRGYKPVDNFMIIGEGDSMDGDYMDGAEASDDSMDFSDDDTVDTKDNKCMFATEM